jgi:hypothetical protein
MTQVVVKRTRRPSKLLACVSFLGLLLGAPSVVYPLPHGIAPIIQLTPEGNTAVHDPVLLSTVVTVTATGAGSFVIPAGVTSIDFEAWGAGDSGGTGGGTGQEAGGGGGGYVLATLTVTPGDTVFYSVAPAPASESGAAETWFQLNTNSQTGAWQAHGGLPPSFGSSGGATSNGTVGTLVNSSSGGAGAAAQAGGGSRGGSGGGGGAGKDGGGLNGAAGVGSAAGAGGAGDNGLGGAPGTVPGGAGNSNVEGGAGGSGGGGSGGTAGVGGAPGGGGGGGGSSSGISSLGARGQIRYTYTAAVAGIAIPPLQPNKPFQHMLVR